MLTHRRRKEIASLRRKKGRDALRAFLVEGTRLVESAALAGAALQDVVATEAALARPRVQAALELVQAPVHVVEESVFAGLSDVRHSQGVLAVAAIPEPTGDPAARARSVLALDGVQDPGNVGTLVRTAAWFGVDVVLAGPGTADFFGPKVVRSAMGGLWDVGLVSTDDLPDALARLAGRGFTRYGADLDGTAVGRWQPAHPSVLVLGSEAHGLSTPVQARIDERIVIPRPGSARPRAGVESLNVAIAGAVLMQRWQG